MTERMAVGEVEAAYMLGAGNFSEGRRLLRGLTPINGPSKQYRIADLKKLTGEDERGSEDPAKAKAALIARAQDEARAAVRRREGRKTVLAAEQAAGR